MKNNYNLIEKWLFVHLNANSLEGLVWGLTNFDGIEFDLRLCKDQKLVIFHDPALSTGELISSMTSDQLSLRSVQGFEKFLMLGEVKELINQGKTLWIELKPDCINGKPDTSIADIMFTAFNLHLRSTNFPQETIRIISFSKELLKPFIRDSQFPCYPLIPNVNECNSKFVLLKNLPKVLLKSLTAHIKEAKDKGYAGLLFARQYILGPIAKRHPNYQKLTKLMKEYNIELGTNLGVPDLEPLFPLFHRFTDNVSRPRLAKQNQGLIIAHRGVGTKGIEIE